MDAPSPELSGDAMRDLLAEVGQLLDAQGLEGEIVLAGGAVIVMVLAARGGSRDIDAVFVAEARAIQDSAREVAGRHGLPATWLNDHVKIFVADDAPTQDLFAVPGLRVRMVTLEYLFYMKAWAGDPVDQLDMLAIARELGLRYEAEAYEIVRRYSPGELTREIEILLESLFE